MSNGGDRRRREQCGLGRLRKNINLIRVLGDENVPPKVKKALAEIAPADLYGSVSDCCRNVLHGRVKLTPDLHRQLAVHQETLRMLANPRVSVKRKRREVVSAASSKRQKQHQKGGFLVPLLAAVIPAAVELLIRHFSGRGRTSVGKQQRRK
jgi:hypothetical protein